MSPQFTQCTQHQILLAGKGRIIAVEQELVARSERQPVVEIDGEEDRGDVVIAVIAAAEYLQTEVEFRRSGDLDGEGDRLAHAAATEAGAERVRVTHSATERVSARRIGSMSEVESQ